MTKDEGRMTNRNSSTLDSSRPAFGESADLLERGHGGVAGESGDECAVRPAELDGFFRRFSSEQSVEKAGGITVSAADAINHIQFTRRRNKALAINPGDCAPAMAVGRMDFA